MTQTADAFDAFFSVIQKLRAPDGCPWDREQTPLSMRTDLLEEVYEAVEAVAEDNPAHAKEELGDVMLNAVMTAYMYQQQQKFTVAEVFHDVAEKLIRRHPHVFPQSEGTSQMNGTVSTSGEVLTQWDAIKRNVEGRAKESVMDEIPEGLPPLLKAAKMQKKAAKKGFDWQNPSGPVAKILEELEEVRQAAEQVNRLRKNTPVMAASANTGSLDGGTGNYPAGARSVPPAAGNQTESVTAFPKPFTVGADARLNAAQLHLEEEIGDLLFAVVNLARHYSVDPALALAGTNEKFARRFRYVEQAMKQAGLPMNTDHLEQMDAFWEDAKHREQNK